jgi:Type II secretion system (T2SS), protein E, N-terminal domain
MSISEAPQPETFTGITPPTRRGGSSRHLTDVVAELGFADKKTVARGVEDARSAGVPAERMLLDQQALTAEQLARAIAERYGLDHLDLGVFKVDMAAANLLSAAAANQQAGADAARTASSTADSGRDAAPPRLPGRVPERGPRAPRLHMVRGDGLPRPDRAVRRDRHVRGAPLAHPKADRLIARWYENGHVEVGRPAGEPVSADLLEAG